MTAVRAIARPFRRSSLLGAPIDSFDPDGLMAVLDDRIRQKAGAGVVGLSGPLVTQIRRDVVIRREYERAEIVVPDGKGIEWAGRWLGISVGPRFAIPDVCDALVDLAAAKGYRLVLFGATENSNARAVSNLRKKYPALNVDGRHGFYGSNEEAEVVSELRAMRPDVLLIALPTPAKERFVNDHAPSLGAVAVAAGGYLDVLSGERKRAPRAIQRAGLEWVWRFLQEPRRLFRRVFLNNIVFAGLLLRALVFGGKDAPASLAAHAPSEDSTDIG